MKQISGNLWDYAGKPNIVICITTNGFVKANGLAVMGRGCAYEATQRYPRLQSDLGLSIKSLGNIVKEFWYDHQCVVTFPVKHNWWEVADLALILKSSEQLHYLATIYPENTYILPKPGCGNGHQTWEEVEPLLRYLPDNVWVIDYAKTN